MTHEGLKRAQWLVKQIKNTEQNLNQDQHVEVNGYGGWSMCNIPEVHDALDELKRMGDQIMKAQGRATLSSMKAELLSLGVED
jgi:hypothetical protein